MPEPLFILAPPRSFTSVVGGMIGQHPQAYGLPEVNLSLGETLGEAWDSSPIAANYATSGLLRTLAQLHEAAQNDAAVARARKWILARPHWSPARVFAHIQECAGTDRILVEKSPRNTQNMDNLKRLLRAFPRANFLHLTRHPSTHGASVIALMQSYGEDRDLLDPEKSWYRAHRNILELANSVSPGQYMQIKGEMLLSNPELYLAQICEWLDLDHDAASLDAMMHPEHSPFAAIGPASAPFGNDPNFLLDPKLDPERLRKIKEPALDAPVEWKKNGAGFAMGTLRMARRFGY